MVDPSVLSWLSNGLTIGGAEYYVAWDTKADVAIIVVQLGFNVDFINEHPTVLDLVGEDGKRLEFPSELKAHAFLLELKEENEDTSV